MKIYTYIKSIAIGTLCLLMCSNLQAQSKSNSNNYVVNEFGEPIRGATLLSEFGETYSTSKDGSYEFTLEDGSAFLTVSAEGYLDVKVSMEQIENKDRIVLPFDAHNMGGTINTGYNTYSSESFTGSASTVTGTELDKSPTSILSETLAGRLPGLSVISRLSEFTFFGRDNTLKAVRGASTVNGIQPLIVIDGAISPSQYYEFISPRDIDNITVLKDASATAAYGIEGANGAIIINTKRGHIGERKLEVFFDQSYQFMTKTPDFVNSARYAELRNEAGERDGLGAFSQYTQNDINQFRSGSYEAYPNTDWYNMFVKDFALRQRVGFNVSGGSGKFKHFSSLNFINQDQVIKIADEPDRKYSPEPHAIVANFRTNMDVKFNDYVSGFMRLAGSVKNEKVTGAGFNTNAYRSIFNLPPTLYGPLSPVNETNPELGDQVVTIDGIDNPAYGLINRSGFTKYLETNIIAQAGLNLNLNQWVKGLSMEGSMAYQTYMRNETKTSQEFQRVIRGNDLSNLDDFTIYKSFENTPLNYGKNSTTFYNINLRADIAYKRQFGDHTVNAKIFSYFLTQEKETTGNSNLILPYNRQNFGLSALYGYKDRYFLKGDMAYSGSEQFSRENRFITTPALSAAWIASNENFFKSEVVSLLKLRASYGITANDQIGGARFLFLDNIRADGSEREIGNPELSAEKIKKLNVGFDLGLLNIFTISAEYFSDNVDNMLINSSSTIPEYQGIPLQYYPKLNNGEMKNSGYEISLGFNKHFSKDFSLYAYLNAMQVKNEVINIDETALGDDYAYPYREEEQSVGQLFGYVIDNSNGNGYFNSAAELQNSKLTYSFGNPRVGDFIYKDLNNDNIIDEKDQAPMGNSYLPEQEYTLNTGFTWKNWEVSFLFHAVKNTSTFTGGLGAYEDERFYSDIHLNAWTPERYTAGEDISYPALSLSPSTNQVNNDYFLMDRSYLRLRNLEVAYTLPISLFTKDNSDTVRLALNAQNVFTIDKVRSKYIDPEIGDIGTFQPFRTYNLNINFNF